MDNQQTKPKGNAENKLRKGEFIVLAAILLIGLFLRGSYLLEIVKSPNFTVPMVDEAYNDYWARGLVTGNWSVPGSRSDPEIRGTPYFRPPGYPYFLAFVYSLTGSSFLAVRIIQMGLGLANCVLAYILGRRLFGMAVGLLFAGFMAVYWVFIFFEGELLAPVLLVFLGLCLILVLGKWVEKFTLARCLWGGVLLGFFALVRPNILLFVPVVLGWGWWLKRRRNDARSFGIMTAGFLAGTAAVIAPVTLRNYIVANDFVPISSNAGINLYIGNNQQTDGFTPVISDLPKLTGLDGWTCFDYPQIVRGVESHLGRKMRHSEVSSYFIGEAIHYMRNNRGQTAKLMLKKARLFWGPAEVSNNKEISCAKELSATLRYIPGFALPFSGAVLGLMLLALDLKKRQKEKEVSDTKARESLEVSLLIVLFIGTYFVSFLPFFIAARFRVPVIPFLFLFGAYGLYRIGWFVAKRDFRRGLFWLAVWAALYVPAVKLGVPYKPSWARWYISLGNVYRRKGQTDLAIAEYHKAIEADIEDPQAYVFLGDIFEQQGKFNDAATYYRQALEVRPEELQALNNFGTLLAKQGKLDQAVGLFNKALEICPDFAAANCNLGNALSLQGKMDEAAGYWTKSLRLKPDQAEVLNNLGKKLYQDGRIDDAIEYWKRSLQVDPGQHKVYFNLGYAASKKGKNISQAMELYLKAIQLKPDYYQARTNLAQLLARQGKTAEAIRHWRLSLEVEAKQADARQGLGKALVKQGKITEAVLHFKEAVRLKPDRPDMLKNLAWILATYRDEGVYNPDEAVLLAENACALTNYNEPIMLDTLAAAYAATGQYKNAVETAQRAVDLTLSLGRMDLARTIDKRLELYKAGKPYYERP